MKINTGGYIDIPIHAIQSNNDLFVPKEYINKLLKQIDLIENNKGTIIDIKI